MNISPDSQTMVLLCSRLGLPSEPVPTPLTLRDWNPLARKLHSESLKPSSLLDFTKRELVAQLELSSELAERIYLLLERRGTLAIELERLESLGVRVLTRADKDYPIRYRQRLKESAPAVLFYAGNKDLLGQPGIAVVGSRNVDQVGQDCAAYVGNVCANSGMVLYSGGAKGVDTIGMKAALDGRGCAVGILADSLESAIRNPEIRPALTSGDLCLVTPYAPDAGFSVGTAMGRNKLIYTLADYAIVVASDVEKGGTWAGSTEAMKAEWVPVFILKYPDMPEGNHMLLKKGGIPFPYPSPESFSKLPEWLDAQANQNRPKPTQLGLFNE
jgi:predicted Rossmann fold nucleotide-binding protein DprA/Smf involved in DNA uptake